MRDLLAMCAAVGFAAGCAKKEDKKESAQAPPHTTPTPAADAGGAGATATPPTGVDEKLVERGAYLAKAGGCLVCHTALGPTGPDLANAGAGGLEMKEKFGTWRSPNITPDKGTGIGNWTDEQIAVSIREGLRPDGSKLSPMMPYMNYNGMTDEDVRAVVAFLRTLKPIERVVAKSELQLEGMDAPKPPNKAPAADLLAQGEYLANIMLCSHCHWTPNKQLTAPAGPDKLYSGGLPMELPPLGTGVVYSSNITSDPETGIGKWTEDQIFASIKMMQRPDGTMIQGPMLFMQGVWSQMDDKDLKAVAAFVKKLPPVKNKVPKSTFKPHAGPPGGAGSGAAPSAHRRQK